MTLIASAMRGARSRNNAAASPVASSSAMVVSARTCPAEASRTNAAASSIRSIERPFAPNQRAPSIASGSSAEIAAATSARVGPATSGPRVDHHVLDERVVLERVLRAILAVARLLGTAMRPVGPVAAEDDLGAATCAVDHPLHLVGLRLGDERAHLDVVALARIAPFDR